ncbi:MAG: Mov34/MPN/PAD-1 family protein [Myxococcota bacterium]
MTDPRLILADDALRERLWAHARAAYPKECCALLLRDDRAGVAAELVLAENLADKYHALDPATYPRTAERAYVLDPRLIANAERDGKTLVAIVHSHCNVGAYFSDEDVRQALSPFDDGPLYPGVDYVVLDVQADGVRGFEVFGWSDEAQRFIGR